ncbi:hypothetical protein [Bradyrhizobium sp. 132]
MGGGYLENEARLSDVALKWMVAGASQASWQRLAAISRPGRTATQ